MNLLPALYLKLDRWLKEIHGCAKKTYFALVVAYYQVKSPCISDMARVMKLNMRFENVRQRLWRFARHSQSEKVAVYKQLITEYIHRHIEEFSKRQMIVIVDWTDYGKFWALQMAIPFQGRALPIYAAVVDISNAEDMMTQMELEAIRVLYSSIPDNLREYVVIVGDRGFSKVKLFEEIESLGGKYVIRVKKNECIEVEGSYTKLSRIKVDKGQRLTLKEVKFTRVHKYKVDIAIRRLLPGEANEEKDDTYYLATNLHQPEAAHGFYPMRMQIEEMFRDFKSFGLHLDQHQIEQEQTMQTMMLVAVLVYQFILQEGIDKVDKETVRLVAAVRKGKAELSIFSICMAILERFLEISYGSQIYHTFSRFWVLKPEAA